ncbi:MAG: asparagine synthase (glutamine-hydrolyzing) [Candidatus Woesearchaeota archaeon]
MCGIIGFDWKDEELLKKARDKISYRGPDDKGDYFDSNISLGHRRLSIIDLDKRSKQPMELMDRYVITYNGEIYNYKEIKKELSEYDFKTTSDTEVIVYAYDKWGKGCLNMFNGMFAFCIYDKKKKELFLARDRFGIKPLYYIDNGKFAFCSEIKGLLEFLDKKEVNEIGLKQFFNFRFTLGETTLVKGIKKFLPGHYVLYDLNGKKINEYKKYYELKKQEIENKNFDYYKNKLKELMDKSVERRMVADVPVACLLSGGVDSSIITKLAKKYNDKLNTFSIGFDTTNELPFAKKVAEYLNTNHHEFKIDKSNVLDYLDDVVYHMDEPIGDPGFLPIFVLSKEVSKHNKVVLSGDGGDEVFCGYDRYKMFYYGRFLRNFAFFDFNNDILKRLKKMKGKNDYGAFFETIRLFDDEELGKLGVEGYEFSDGWDAKFKDKLMNAQYFDIQTLLPNDFFMKADKMSSAFGLEQRVPFLDHELVEFAFTIPLKYRLKLWNEKYVLRKAFEKDLPKEIVERKKHGFDVPIDYWFKNVLGEKLKGLLDESDHGLYKKDYVYMLLDDIKKKGGNYKFNFILAQKLWSILMFEMWYQELMK